MDVAKAAGWPTGRSTSSGPLIGQPQRRPPGQPDADAAGSMTGQIASHQPAGETGGAEHHHVQLTVLAHPVILDKPPRRSWARAAARYDLSGARPAG